jgi:hypothetical protein
MSGTIVDNTLRQSGSIAATPAGLSWQDVVTASTVTVSAGKGYWINTTSNACTITLPASAEAGDNIVIVDYARTWGTNAVTLDSNGLNFQGNADTYTVEYTTDGQSVNLVYSDSTKGWLPLEDDVVADEPVAPPTQKGIFAFGVISSITNISSLVSSSGVISADVSGVGTARQQTMATSFGVDVGLFAFGTTGSNVNTRNLVNNSGVVAADATGAGTVKSQGAAAVYGSTGQAIIAYGHDGGYINTSNLVNNSGVVGSDVTGVGSARGTTAAAGYGGDKAIFAYGYALSPSGRTNLKNLVSNTGVVAADAAGVGTARAGLAAAAYGGDKAIFAYGDPGNSNLVSNTGVVAADVTAVGTNPREGLAATNYGGDKAIFFAGSDVGVSNLVNSSGVVAADVAKVGSKRQNVSGCGFSISA